MAFLGKGFARASAKFGAAFIALSTYTTYLPAYANDVPKARVGTALVLCMDSSGSIDAGEYRLQRDGTADAFLNPYVVSKIVYAGLAVKVIDFDSNALTRMNWQVLRTEDDVRKFAEALRTLSRTMNGGTHVDACVQSGITSMAEVPAFAAALVIDVSGDEFSGSSSGAIQAAKLKAQSFGIRVNGLPITSGATYEGADIQLIGGFDQFVRTSDGFIEIARGFEDFKRAMTRKLQNKIAGAPEVARYAALSSPRP